MFAWPVNKHVNCQVKDIELQFIVAPPRPHHTMLVISIAHLRMTWSTLFGRGQGEGWKQNFYSVESLWFFRSIPVMFWIHVCDCENLQGAKVQCWKGEKKNLFFHIVGNFAPLFLLFSVWKGLYHFCSFGIAASHFRIFLIWFSGSVLFVKGLYYFCSNCWNCSFALLNFLSLFWVLDPCDCENLQGAKVQCSKGEEKEPINFSSTLLELHLCTSEFS